MPRKSWHEPTPELPTVLDLFSDEQSDAFSNRPRAVDNSPDL